MSKDRGTVTGQIVLVGSCLQFPAKEKGQAYFSTNWLRKRHKNPPTWDTDNQWEL